MILNRLFWFVTGYSHSKWKTKIFLETFGAPLKKEQHCSFHGTSCIYHFQSRKCLEYCFLILPKFHAENLYLFLNFGCSVKVASIFFFLWSTLYIVFSMCKVSWFLIVDFTLSLVTQTLRVKRFYSESLVFCKRSNDVDRAPGKMVLILLVDFDLSLFARIP